jgi:hypothetical protein
VLGDDVLAGVLLDVGLGDVPGAGLGSAGARVIEPTEETAFVADPATLVAVLAASVTLPISPRSRACSTASLLLRAA